MSHFQFDLRSSQEFIPHRLTAKCILVGDAGVGKSSILQRILGRPFNGNIGSTIGVEFGATTIPLSQSQQLSGENHSKKQAGYSLFSFPEPRAIKLQIWDAAGQERFRSIVQSYYRNTAVILLVFDLTARHSLEGLSFWISEIERIRGIDHGWPLFYLIGNKADLSSNERTVFPEHIEQLTKTTPIRAYREVSAKNGTMIDTLLQEIAKDVDQELPEQRTENRIPGIVFTNFGLEESANGARGSLGTNRLSRGGRGSCC